MALVRMRESICMNSSYYTDITKSAPESIKESLKNIPGERLNESVIDDSVKSAILQIKEAKAVSDTIVDNVVTKLRERGVSLNERKIYRVPVGRWDNVNGNRRVYTRKLWENVMNKQQDAWKGLCGLADHPTADNDPGSIKNSSIVWLGMELDDAEKIVYGIGTFVGALGHMFQEIIDAGGRVGFSSSGFGEIMADGQTVDPDTYQIERLADVVLNPSQEVYGVTEDEQGLGNIEYTKQHAVMEESKSSNNLLKESTNMEEKKSILTKVEEKAFRNYVKSFIEDANNMKSPNEQLRELQNINEMFEEGVAPDLKAQLEEKIAEKQHELESIVESAVAMQEELGVSSLEDITEGTKKVIEEGTALAEQVVEYKSIIDGMTARNKELSEKVEKLQAGYAATLKERDGLKKENKTLNESLKDLNLKVTVREAKELEDRDQLNEATNTAISSISAKYNEASNALREAQSALSEKSQIISGHKECINKLRAEKAQLQESLDKATLKISIREARAEKASKSYNAEIVHTQESIDRIRESANKRVNNIKKTASEKIGVLTERLNTYRKGNEKLEKTVSILESKIKTANTMLSNLTNANEELKESTNLTRTTFVRNIINSLRKINESGTCELTIDDNGNILMTKLSAENADNKMDLGMDLSGDKMDSVSTDEVKVADDPNKDKDSISDFMDFRESAPIEKYWNDQYAQFGEALLPYEHKIRGAKTLAESQREFFKVLPFISGKINEARINPKAIRQERLDESIINLQTKKTPSQSMAEKFGLL